MVIYIYLDSVLDRHRVLLHNYCFGEAESTNTSFPYQFLVKGGGKRTNIDPFVICYAHLKSRESPALKNIRKIIRSHWLEDLKPFVLEYISFLTLW